MDESTKILLLAGLPFDIVRDKNIVCTVMPLTLKQIAKIKYDKYNLYLSNLLADISDYNIPDLDLSQYTYWDIFINNMCHGDIEYSDMFLEALSIFLNNGIYFDKQNKLFYTDTGQVINKDTFDEFRQILKWQNCIDKSQNEEEKYSDEKAKTIANKFKKFREKIKPQKNENAITLKDMISGVSARHPSINLYNIWDLTIYQLYDQFSRLNLVDNYNASIFLLPYSEDAGKNIKHWATTIIKEDDI